MRHRLFSKVLLPTLAGLILTFTILTNAKAQTPGEFDPTFAGGVMTADTFTTAVSPGNNNGIYALAVQPDGKHIIAGLFRTINGTGRNYIARVNADGTLDSSFDSGIGLNNNVNAVALQPDGKILVGGGFSNFTDLSGITTKGRIARLNANGTLDTTFGNNGGANSGVNCIILQPDGKILISGVFTSFDGVARNRIARLNADGSLDLSFDAGTGISSGGLIEEMALRPDGKIYVVGNFTTFNSIARKNIVRLNADGSVDTTFDPGTSSDGTIESVALQPDGKILIGGTFNTYTGGAAFRIARVNPDGTKDNFLEGTPCPNPCPPGSPNYLNLGSGATDISVTGDGKIYVSAKGRTLNGGTSYFYGIYRFNTDGSSDSTFARFAPLAGDLSPVVGIHALQADGKILTNLGRKLPSSSEVQSGMVRVNTDGTFDNSYAPVIGTGIASIHDLLIQPDGKLLAVGEFNTVGTTARIGIARFNTNGTLDATYTARTDGVPLKILRQPDGKIIVAGGFGQVNGVTRARIARLNEDGSLDISFNPQPGVTGGLTIFTAALQSDGKTIIGGNFTAYNGVNRSGIARLNADGSLDTTFNPGAGVAYSDNVRDGIKSIVVQPDGKILIGGKFNSYNSVQRFGIARLNFDGTLDTTFNSQAGFGSAVNAIHLFADGKMLVGGAFGLNFAGNGRSNIARLNADGTLDSTFGTNGSSPNGTVSEIYVQSNGKILIGGLFGTVAGQNRRGIARINADGSLDATFGNNTFGSDPFDGVAAFWRDMTGLAVDEASGKLYFGAAFSTFNNVGRGSLARLFTGSTQNARTKFDFDGDGKADVSVFRPSNSVWYIQQSQNGFTGVQFGVSTDRIAPADYDGDGKTDLAVFRDGVWYLQRSQLGFTGIQFGTSGDIPVPADYDADGKADLAVFRPSTGVWYLQQSTNGFTGVQFGQNGDKPVAADYDGDGKADLGVFRSGIWYLQRSSLGFTGIQFGIASDKAVPADYDADGKADLAVFRDGTWYLQRSTEGFTGISFGLADDLPAPADFDGDAKSDLAVFRPSSGTWYLQRSQLGFTGVQFGASGDKPIPNAFVQ